MGTVQVVGSRIRRIRDMRGLTQGQLAYKADTTVTQISRLENDERPGAQAVIVARIAAALGTSVDYLMGITDNPSMMPGTNGLSPEARELVDRIEPLLDELAEIAPESLPHIRNLFHMQLESHLAAIRAVRRKESERRPEPGA